MKHNMKAAYLLVLLLFISHLTHAQSEYIKEIKTIEHFEEYKGQPLGNNYGQVDALKIVWDIKTKDIYYLRSSRFNYHRRFCNEVLKYSESHEVFNERNYYTTNQREYYLTTINHFKAQNLYVLEFSVLDEILPEQIQALYDKITSTFHLTDTLKIFLNNAKLTERMANYKKIPTITPNEVYAGQEYQPLNLKTGVGYLRKIPIDSIKTANIRPYDIVVVNGTPDDIPPVEGVITTNFQTPLSHINVLCQNRGTPIMAHKNAWKLAKIDSMVGKLVAFKVGMNDFELKPIEKEKAERYWQQQKKEHPFLQLRADTSSSALVALEDLNYKTIHKVGGKASNFGELNKVLSESASVAKLPEGGFAIPFYYYNQHLSKHGIWAKINALVQNKELLSQPDSLQAALVKIRTAIASAPIDSALLSLIEKQVRATSPVLSMRFRSSTNAEDIDGFNGAGLYTSKTGIIGNKEKSVEQAIQKVWASVWNYKAFTERAYFNIDHQTVMMGILVHRSFPNELANGVAITKNIYRETNVGFILNIQLGETSVVQPPEGVTCDQLVCYSATEKYEESDVIGYMSYSSLNKGKPVLSKEEVVALTKELGRIKKHFYTNVNKNYKKIKYLDFAMDVEFKIYGENRQIYIKQARPYR